MLNQTETLSHCKFKLTFIVQCRAVCIDQQAKRLLAIVPRSSSDMHKKEKKANYCLKSSISLDEAALKRITNL